MGRECGVFVFEQDPLLDEPWNDIGKWYFARKALEDQAAKRIDIHGRRERKRFVEFGRARRKVAHRQQFGRVIIDGVHNVESQQLFRLRMKSVVKKTPML